MNVYRIRFDTIEYTNELQTFGRNIIERRVPKIKTETVLIAAPKFSIPYFEKSVNPEICSAELYDEDVYVQEGRIWFSEKEYKDDMYEDHG